MNIDELRKNAEEKTKIYLEISRRVNEFRYEREQHYKSIVAQEIKEKFGDTLMIASQERAETDKLLNNAMNEKKVQDTLARIPYPEGTVLVKWASGRWNEVTKRREMVKTNDRGVVQVYREGDPCPSNTRWNKPYVGDMIVRLVKKDGSLGIQLQKVGLEFWGWYPEGVDPNDKKQTT